MLILQNSKRECMPLKNGECIKLELAFNITSMGKKWKHLGDLLFFYGIGDGSNEVIKILDDVEWQYLHYIYLTLPDVGFPE